MGYDNIEPVQTEWGGLIPGLQAEPLRHHHRRHEHPASRCENIAFSEPMAKIGDAFIVAKGNPKGIGNYEDIKTSGADHGDRRRLFEHRGGQGRRRVRGNIMEVPGPTEILAAVKAGRADAGAGTYFTVKQLADSAPAERSRSPIPTRLPEDAGQLGRHRLPQGGPGLPRHIQRGAEGISRLAPR